MTNTQDTPIEARERTFPLRVLRSTLRRGSGSGGAGWAPCGEGIERDLLMLEDVTVSLITERRVSQPWGLAGGEPGAVGENWLLPGGDETRAERLLDKCMLPLKAGDAADAHARRWRLGLRQRKRVIYGRVVGLGVSMQTGIEQPIGGFPGTALQWHLTQVCHLWHL